MDNYDYYKNDLINMLSEDIAVVDGCVMHCEDVAHCIDCDLHTEKGGCTAMRKKWLLAEHKEPEIDWSKVPVGTHVWVRDDDRVKWTRALFLGLENDEDEMPFNYHVTMFDIWVFGDRETTTRGMYFAQCRLDDEVDPTPYYKE